MDKSNFLIDFSSPAQKNELKPLIPVPPQTSLAPKEIVEPYADPFDVQEIKATDPFESVLQHALNRPNSNSGQPVAEDPFISSKSHDEDSHPGETIKSESCHTDNKKTLREENSEKKVNAVSCTSDAKISNEMPNEKHDRMSCRNKIPNDCNVNATNLNNTSQVKNIAQDTLKNSSKCSDTLESENQSQISSDFSTEERLKAVIAQRVRRCIQDTLNGSLKTSKNGNSSVLKKRSLSFIGLSTESGEKNCDRLNKSCTDVDSFNLENQQLDGSSDSSGFGLLSQNSSDASTEETPEDQVFKEARKLSRTFSKLAQSFCKEEEPSSDDEDLLSCKPRWLYTDSSEDEEEKLLKDPALNLRRRSDSSACSSPAPQPSKGADSPALLAYKSRRSVTQLHAALNNTQEDIKLKRSFSVGSQMKVMAPPASIVPINIIKTDNQPIKLRKKTLGDTKKGPLRAILPIQSMTKEPLPNTGKLASKQDTSPEARIQKSVCAVGTPNKDNSQLNITPMASSTPNKTESFTGNIGNGSLLIKSVTGNKRHSLEGSFGSHKSRGVNSEDGARPRSNSASSSIPRVLQVKPFGGLPLAPKSTSNLPRNTQKSANSIKSVPEKKNTMQLKSSINSRVLTDVKTKSPLQRKVRAAANTLSNLVRGKKTAAQDKENRVPA